MWLHSHRSVVSYQARSEDIPGSSCITPDGCPQAMAQNGTACMQTLWCKLLPTHQKLST